jgi:PAS domain S-box-containing protein
MTTDRDGRSALWRLVGADLLDEMPCAVMLMDRDLRIVDHNRAFADVFGDSVGKRCFEVYKDRGTACPECVAQETFQDGQQRILEESGLDRHGQTVHYLAQLTPLRDAQGEVAHLAAITTDLTTTKRLQREYQTLFEKVPCYVAVLNRKRRVVKANELFRRTFGEPRGEHCYELFKQRQQECEECPAARTFTDGGTHTSRHIGTAQDGTTTHYVVSTAPLLRGDGEVTHVIEMCLDVTEMTQLEAELRRASAFRRNLVESSLDAIVVTDAEQRVVLMNKAAEELWGVRRENALGRKVPRQLVPAPLRRRRADGDDEAILLHEQTITSAAGEEIPVRLVGMTLQDQGKPIGGAVIAQDLREIKELERQKLAAERLAAVGQTVAGLAHGIKNVLMGLEGGMYAFQSGMTRGDNQRMLQGWHMLEDNIARITSFVKEFLEFARGREITVRPIDPNETARQVIALFRDKAALEGITIHGDLQDGIPYAPMDEEGIHTCLVNLVSNALDACEISDQPERRVLVRTRDREGVLVFEVADNGVGIDYEIKKKVFTTFFSTKKVGKGTGLGLLTTSKIVQEHGGKVSFESTEGKGSLFRLQFPRERLPSPAESVIPPGRQETGRNEPAR